MFKRAEWNLFAAGQWMIFGDSEAKGFLTDESSLWSSPDGAQSLARPASALTVLLVPSTHSLPTTTFTRLVSGRPVSGRAG